MGDLYNLKLGHSGPETPGWHVIEETVTYDQFTDGGATTGTYVLTAGSIPIRATVLRTVLTSVTGFAGDTSATIQVGDGTDADRYSTGTPDVFSTIAGGLDLGLDSGVSYHAAAKSVTVTITSAADFTSVSAGAFTIRLFYVV